MTTRELLDKFIFNISEADSLEKLIFLQDTSLCQGLIAWKNMNVDFSDIEIGNVELNENSWTSLWDYSDFDIDNFATIIGKKYSEAEDVLKRLAFLKYIYPDGTVNEIALSYSRNVSKNMISKVFAKSKFNKNGDKNNEK